MYCIFAYTAVNVTHMWEMHTFYSRVYVCTCACLSVFVSMCMLVCIYVWCIVNEVETRISIANYRNNLIIYVNALLYLCTEWNVKFNAILYIFNFVVNKGTHVKNKV